MSVYSSMTIAGKENMNIYKTNTKRSESDTDDFLNLSFTDLVPRGMQDNRDWKQDSDEEKEGKTEEYTNDPMSRKQSVSMHSYRKQWNKCKIIISGLKLLKKQSIAGLSWEQHSGEELKHINDVKFQHPFHLITMLDISNNKIQVISKFIGMNYLY